MHRLVDSIHFMVLSDSFFATITSKTIADARSTAEVLTALRGDRRSDAVAEAAAGAGSRAAVRPPTDMGWMYQRAAEDPDGHIVEAVWMDMEAASAAMAVDNEAVDVLHDIDRAPELGLFAEYLFAATSDPRDRRRVDADVTQDVTSAHGGYVASVSGDRWLSARRHAALGLSLGAGYRLADRESPFFPITPQPSRESGQRVDDAGAGLRDVKATVVFAQPLSEKRVVGLGVPYTCLPGSSADSPIVTDGGSPNQYVCGFGVARIFRPCGRHSARTRQ